MATYPTGMVPKAHLEIVLRNGQQVVVNFDDDEEINAVMERLKKCVIGEGIFFVEMKNLANNTVIHHYLPSRDIVRFALVQYPRVPHAQPA